MQEPADEGPHPWTWHDEEWQPWHDFVELTNHLGTMLLVVLFLAVTFCFATPSVGLVVLGFVALMWLTTHRDVKKWRRLKEWVMAAASREGERIERQNAAALSWMKNMTWEKKEPAFDHVLATMWNLRRGVAIEADELYAAALMHPDLVEEALQYWSANRCAIVRTLSDGTEMWSLTETGRELCMRRLKVSAGDRDLEAAMRETRDRGQQSHGNRHQQFTFNISGGTFGQLNTAVATLTNLETHIRAIGEGGQAQLAHALKRVGQAVVDEPNLSAQAKADLIDNLNDISQAATEPPAQRRQGRLRAAISTVSAAAGAGTKLHEAWAAWGPQMEQLLR